MTVARLRIASWNINGIRAATNKGFLRWLRRTRPDIVGLQEVRAKPEQMPVELRRLRAWQRHDCVADRPGYSGVSLLSRLKASEPSISGMGQPCFDTEGRCQMLRIGGLLLVNSYFPNGNGIERDNSRVPYKLSYYRRLWRLLRPSFEAGEAIVVLGDFNTAHQDIDLARPKQNKETSGFLEVERQELSRWLEAGWVDSFRRLHPGQAGHYTWWSQRAGVRERNIGWRIDYALLSPAAMPYLAAASIESQTRGSDHCPIWVELHREVIDRPWSTTLRELTANNRSTRPSPPPRWPE